MTYAIELAGITKTFGRTVAVDQLDLAVPYGSIYGFIGPNGSGKTTTLRMILRILRPDSGLVRVLGEDQGSVADDRVGYLPEERGLYKRMKVRDILTYYARLKGRRDSRGAIDGWLERFELAEWATKRVDTLSKGMAQKVQFIAAVVARPQLVILDEPFTGLDPVNMEVLKEAVLSLRTQGTTIVFSTHDMDMAERLCDVIFMIFRGRKVLDGSLDAIQADFPADRVRVRLADPHARLPEVRGISEVRLVGRCYEFRLEDPTLSQAILQRLAAQVDVHQFEIRRPSLHDVFVQIARPQEDERRGTGQDDETHAKA
jgi:ABC-2 type transport system ATP-binding protein